MSSEVCITPCGNAELLAIKLNVWARSLSYEAVCFDIIILKSPDESL